MMKVDSTTNKFSYSTMVDADEDLLAMAGSLLGDDHSHNTGNRAEMRKSNKPIMEKRRRARINTCLNELKNILLEAMKKDPARHSKLEKADILELTVRHLQNIQRNQLAIAMATDPTVLHRFKNGFSECVQEVNRHLGRLEGADPGVRQRLLDHLGNCVSGLQQVGPTPFGSTGSSFPGANPCVATFPAAVPPAMGLHPPVSTMRLASSTQPPSAAATAPFSDDLNNNLLNSPVLGRPQQHHLHDVTSARLMSAFAVAATLPRRPMSPPSSPPSSFNISSSSHESSSTPSMLQLSTSSRNDSGLSDASDLGSGEMNNSGSSTTRNGDPIDFSIGKVLKSGPRGEGVGGSEELSGSRSNVVRVVKVEPMMPSIIAPSPDESGGSNKDMWRPW